MFKRVNIVNQANQINMIIHQRLAQLGHSSTRDHRIGHVLILALLVLLVSGCVSRTAIQNSPTVAPEIKVPSAALVGADPTVTASPQPTRTPTTVPTAAPTTTPTGTQTPRPSNTPTITPIPSLIVDAHGASLVLVPAGEFIMGSEVWSGSEAPTHHVYLDAFYIDQYEVSVAAYAEFLNEAGNQIEGVAGKAHWVEESDEDLHLHRSDGIWQPDEGRADHPMNEVTWFGARAFCEWRGARLPSEAEWEKAARGVDGRTYPWGEDEPTCEMANFVGCFYDSVPVDSYPQSVSPYGAYNMAGNVHEWTNDWYHPDYYTESPLENPTGPETGDYKIFRGASWFNGNFQTRTTYRYPKLPVLTYKANGFRCAVSLAP